MAMTVLELTRKDNKKIVKRITISQHDILMKKLYVTLNKILTSLIIVEYCFLMNKLLKSSLKQITLL